MEEQTKWVCENPLCDSFEDVIERPSDIVEVNCPDCGMPLVPEYEGE